MNLLSCLGRPDSNCQCQRLTECIELINTTKHLPKVRYLCPHRDVVVKEANNLPLLPPGIVNTLYAASHFAPKSASTIDCYFHYFIINIPLSKCFLSVYLMCHINQIITFRICQTIGRDEFLIINCKNFLQANFETDVFLDVVQFINERELSSCGNSQVLLNLIP